MIKILTKELLYFFAILIILALLQHSDLLNSPMTRFEQMQNNGNYLHPFLWSGGVYILFGIFRLAFKVVLYIKNKNKQ